MATKGPETAWQRFRRTPAPFDLATSVVSAGGLFGSAVRFFADRNSVWGWVNVGLGAVVIAVQCLGAHATYIEQRKKDSVHELQGCLHALETVLLGPDLTNEGRQRVGLRLTIHVPDERDPALLTQVMNYVGDNRGAAQQRAGRTMASNMGVVGQAYQRARLNRNAPLEMYAGFRTGNDLDAFRRQMVLDYAFSPEAARSLNPETQSWVAVPIASTGGTVEGVLYCDAKTPDFFSDSRKEDILHATVGIAYFISLRYSKS
jgi:hypothetical protein